MTLTTFSRTAAARLGLVGLICGGVGYVVLAALRAPAAVAESGPAAPWVERGFEAFRGGTFEDAGADLYVSAAGVVQRIHQYDLDASGSVDLLFVNTHDTNERADTYVYWGSKNGFDRNRRLSLEGDGVHSARIADLNADGRQDLVLGSYYNGDTYNLESHVYFGNGSGLDVERRLNLPTAAAKDVVVADFDRNGDPDLFFAVPWRDEHFEAVDIGGLLYRRASGRFTLEPKPSVICRGSVAAYAEDLNGDGYVDLVLANERADRNPETDSFVYWNGPDGFSAARRTNLPVTGAAGIAVGDVSGDRLPDIAFASAGKSTPVFLNAAGAFSPSRVTHLPQASTAVAFGDVDRDGDLDVVLTLGDQVTAYLTANGAIGTRPAWSLPASDAAGITIDDLNRDGFPELVVSNQSAGLLYDTDSFVYWGGPEGYAAARRTALPTHGAIRTVAGDLNGDGISDLVVVNTKENHVETAPLDSYIYLGDDKGRFSPDRRVGLQAVGANDATTPDLNGDGYPEVILVSDGLRQKDRVDGVPLYWNGPGGFTKKPFVFPLLGARGSAVADLNHDGYLDILLSNPFTKSLPEYPTHSSYIFWGGPDGYDPKRFHTFATPHAYRSYLADFDNDGNLDLVAGLMYLSRVSVYWGNAQGKFSEDVRTDLPTFLCNTVNAADLDGDGYIDILAGSKGSRENAEEPAFVYWGGPAKDRVTRAGVFALDRRTELPTSAGSRSCIGDFNRDGRLDVCITNYLGNKTRRFPTYVYWGDGRRFAGLQRMEIPFEAGSGAISADMNRDGWPDLAIVSHKSGSNHNTVSKVFWGHERGLLHLPTTDLPTVGAHQLQGRNIGHAATRGPGVAYVSAPRAYRGSPLTLSRQGATPGRTALTFQVRTSPTREGLDAQPWSSPLEGESVNLTPLGLASLGWIQYRADFISPDGGQSPSLREVRVTFR
jgi:hypothetical protein